MGRSRLMTELMLQWNSSAQNTIETPQPNGEESNYVGFALPLSTLHTLPTSDPGTSRVRLMSHYL